MKKNTPALVLLLLVVGAIVFLIVKPIRPSGGSGTPQATPERITQKPLVKSHEDTQTPASEPKQGVIYTPSETGKDDGALLPHKVLLSSSDSPATAAVNALIQTPKSPMPSGTELRGIKIADGLATVDFSPEFRDNFHGGDTQAAQTVNSLLETLGQFPTIERVQIWIDGKPVDSMGGLLDISGPLDVIRSGEPRR